MHSAPVLSVSYADNDDTQRQSPALHQQVLHLLLIMDDAVCQDHQDHVISCLILHVLANVHGLSQQRSEESRSAEG